MQYVTVRKEVYLSNDVIAFNTIQSKVFHLIEEIHSQRFRETAKIPLCVNDLILHLNRVVYEQNHLKSLRKSVIM